MADCGDGTTDHNYLLGETMTRWMKTSILTCFTLGAVATGAAAQSASINVTANVYQALTVAAGNDLDFGNVFPGVNKTIALTDATAGRFDITGQSGATASISLTLPANITGPASLPIGSWTACWNVTNNAASGCSSFTAASGTSAAFGAGSTLFVFLGATASPAANQASGSYTGTATLTVAYVN
jgi:hypothetical protein